MSDIQLHLGDCLEVMKNIPDGSVDSVVTDPPYGINYQSARRTDRTQWKPKIVNDIEPFVAWCEDAFRVTSPSGSVLCFCRWDSQEMFRLAITNAGFAIKSQVIWDRVVHGMGDLNGAFAPQHDNLWFGTKGIFQFPRKRPQSVIRIKRIAAEKLLHPNEKPVALLEYLIRAITNPGDTILDLSMGSGTTGVACVKTGRNFIGIEIDPDHFAIAEKRIAEAQMQPRLL